MKRTDPVPAGEVKDIDPDSIPRPPVPPMVWRCPKCGESFTWNAMSDRETTAAYEAMDKHQATCAIRG